MLIKHLSPSTPKSSEITPESVYLNRRQLMAGGAAAAIGAGLALPAQAKTEPGDLADLDYTPRAIATEEALTPFQAVTGYNNFYEFGLGKGDPARNAPDRLKTSPWTVNVSGEVAKPGAYDVDDLIKQSQLEERIYRLPHSAACRSVLPAGSV